MLTALRPKTSQAPLSLFEPEFEGRRLGETLDAITARMGHRAIGIGLGGFKKAPSWNMRREMLSRRALTHWDELCEVMT